MENTTVKEKPSYYSILTADVRYCKELSAQEKLLYSEITALANRKGYCWASNNFFADLYGLSKETVSRQISNLAKHGFIHVSIIYFDDSKQIKERRIYLSETHKNADISDADTPIDKNADTHIDKNTGTHIDKNGKDNNQINSTLNFNNNDVSIYPTSEKPETPVEQPKAAPPIDTIDTPAEIIKVLTKAELAAKISLAELKNKHSDKLEDIEIIFDVLADVLTVENPLSPTLRISKQNIPFINVKAEFQKLESKHIEYVIHSLNNNDNKHKINKNTKSYLLTSLFHAPRTISYYFDRRFSPKPAAKNEYDVEALFEKASRRMWQS